jgi:hypothetical protein
MINYVEKNSCLGLIMWERPSRRFRSFIDVTWRQISSISRVNPCYAILAGINEGGGTNMGRERRGLSEKQI